MQRLISDIQGLPIISLQSGEAIATIRQPIFNITTLEIVGYSCESPASNKLQILLTHDIRQAAADCLVIDNENDLTEPGDIVRLNQHLETNFNPQGKPVHTDTGRRLGTVDDYTIDIENSHLQKLYVRGSLLRSWLGASTTIDRTQIIDVTPKRITVREPVVEARVLPPETLPESPA